MWENNQIFLAGLWCLVSCTAVDGYELTTHGKLTYEAFSRSVLGSAGSTTFLGELGVYNGKNPFDVNYFDVSTVAINQRKWHQFEQSEKRMPEGTEPLSIEGWLMRGAIREDDYTDTNFLICKIIAPNPQEDNFNRPLRHFYDPVNNVGLFGFERGPDWAIGATDAFTQPNTPDTSRLNHYTVFDAREAMYRALTGRTRVGGADVFAIGAGGSIPATAADKEALRKAYWATAFRSVGGALHLIQDVSQPQHSRLDPHPAQCESSFFTLGKGSGFEKYVNTLMQATAAAQLLSGYTTSLPFNDYASFFSTEPGGNVLNGRGLADYSNRGFFSVRTLINDSFTGNSYAHPSQDWMDYGIENIEIQPGKNLRVYTNTVPDSVTGVPDNDVRLISYGLWDEALESTGKAPRYTLNKYNYDDMVRLLLPRAVGYGAGFINYFFRGRMEITPPDEGVYGIIDHAVTNTLNDGFTTVKLKVRNTTPDIIDGVTTYLQGMTGGELRAVAKYRRNPCYDAVLGGELDTATGLVINGCDVLSIPTAVEEISVSQSITVASLSSVTPTQFSFDFSADPIPVNATDLYIQVVYRGGLGSEADAVVVATKDLYEPGYLTVANTSDYVLVNDAYYTPAEIQADPSLQFLIDLPPFGNLNGMFDEDINSFPLTNYEIKFDSSTQVVVSIASVPAGSFFRIGFLTDNPSPVFHLFQNSSEDAALGGWVMTHQYAQPGLFEPGNYVSTPINAYGQYRGTNWHNLFEYVVTYQLVPVGDFSSLGGFVDPNPIPVTILY